MTVPRKRCLGFWALLVLVGASAGLAGGCHDPMMWATAQQDLELPTIGIHTVLVRTENGQVRVRPVAGAESGIHVKATIQAGGRDPADAQDCLDAIEIVTPTSGTADSVQEIRWEWSRPKLPHWAANVSFDVTVPAALDLQAETQNGGVDVAGVTGACELKTTNGTIHAWAVAAERLTASTQNGELDIESPAGQIDLSTGNGRIVAALTGPVISIGHIKTNNGEVRLSVDPAAKVQFQCTTRNGRITNRLSLLDVKQKSKRGLEGRLGAGGGTLEVSTRNGNIRLEPVDPKRMERGDVDN